ncbi:nucleotide-binding domain-containing protein [Cadophora sp. DSE1049]|nr:nucleotide-binding domain-containing protein [Cadophora sp. DSE1049]
MSTFPSSSDSTKPKQPQKQILILGAGITALSTALSLLTTPSTSHFTITLIAAHLPGDLSPEYTSPWAGGDWHSHASMADEDADVRRWDARTYQAWMGLLEGRPVPKDAVFGTSFRTVTFDPVVYLKYLLGRIRELGGRVLRGRVRTEGGLEGVVRGLKKVVKEEDGEREGEDNVFAIINCGGLSARHFLPPPEASKLFPIRGQTVVVKGQAKDAYTYVSIPSVSEDEMLYVIPRPGGITVLGGCKQVGVWGEEVDEEMGERIMERVRGEGLAEELRTGEGGGFEVVRQQVGFRPGRKGGPRVEVEMEKVGGVWVVHSYGHGSGGYQASVGCAERVVELVEGLIRNELKSGE